MHVLNVIISPGPVEDVHICVLRGVLIVNHFYYQIGAISKVHNRIKTFLHNETFNYLWHIFFLGNADKVFKHYHHGRSSNDVTVDQVRQKAHLKRKGGWINPSSINSELNGFIMLKSKVPGKQLHCRGCFLRSPSAAWSSPPQTRPQSCSSWHWGGRLRLYRRWASPAAGERWRESTPQCENNRLKPTLLNRKSFWKTYTAHKIRRILFL